MAKEKTGKQILAATRRRIENSFNTRTPRAGATKRQLKDALMAGLTPGVLGAALQVAGLNWHDATADELNELNYAIRWAVAWGKPLDDYYATAWGEDTGPAATQEELPLAA